MMPAVAEGTPDMHLEELYIKEAAEMRMKRGRPVFAYYGTYRIFASFRVILTAQHLLAPYPNLPQTKPCLHD